MTRLARSFLFVPGDRPDRFDKAAASGAHQVIIDLEDAVGLTDKVSARQSVHDWLAAGHAAGVRINGADTEWFEGDLKMLRSVSPAVVMLPKADAEAARVTMAALPACSVIALVETVKGYMELRPLAAVTGVKRIAFGSVDFGTETGIEDQGDAMTAVRTQIVLESCYAGLEPPIDGVSTGFNNPTAIHQDALRSRQLGFGGKLCIHPKQVLAVNEAYRPTAEQVDWARRVVAAMAASKGAATAVDGKMVDKPVLDQAKRIVAEAQDGPY